MIGFDTSNTLYPSEFKVCVDKLLFYTQFPILQKQIDFGLTRLFNSEWSRFHQLAVLNYSFGPIWSTYYDFGTLHNLTEVQAAVRVLKQVNSNEFDFTNLNNLKFRTTSRPLSALYSAIYS